MNRRARTRARTLKTTLSELRTFVERLESRAMLAGSGLDSLSGLGSATAVLLPGVSSPPGIVLTGGSPAFGSPSGTGGSQSTAPVLLSGSGSAAGVSSAGTSSNSAPFGPVLFSVTGTGAGLAATGSNSGSASIGPVLLSGTGAGADSSGSGTGLNSDPNSPVLSSQYTGGSTTGGQGNGTAGALTTADRWRLYWSGVGAGSSSARSDEGSLADDPTISAQYTGGSGIGRITPLVYNPECDGPPVFQSGEWTGDDGSVQFVQTADTGNHGTGESDASQSDGKSRERSWWGLWGWFLGDDPAQGSLWKPGPSDVLRPGDIGTYNDGKSQSESLEDAGKATKELIDGAGRDAALAVVGGVVGKLQGAPKTLGEVNLKGTIQGYGKTLADEGKFFGWKSSSVSKAADDFTKEQLLGRGWTKERLLEVAEKYEWINKLTPGHGNPSAAGRAAQLREILEKLF